MKTDQIIDKIGLPASEHTERVVLGAILSDEKAALDARMMMRLAYLSLDTHRRVYGAAMAVLARGEDVQLTTVATELEARHELQGVGGRSFIASLYENLPRNLAIESYVDILREVWQRREFIATSERVAQMATDPANKAINLRRELLAAVAMAEADDGTTLHSADEVMDEVFAALDPNQPPPLTTGIQGLDAMTSGGIRRGELWIAGGLPGRGKSSLARQFGYNSAKQGIPTLVHSIEMPRWQWLMLDTATAAKVPAWQLRTPSLIREQTLQYMHQAAVEVRELPLYFEESPDLDKILAKSRVAAVRHGVQLIVVDYVQRVRTGDKRLDEAMGRVALELAQLAKEENVAVLLLSQLTPAQGSNLNTRPTMQSLRQSRDLEAHAHAVLLNYLPVDLETGKFTGEDEIIIGKQRFGGIGAVNVRYDTQFLRFHDREA